MVLVHAAVVAGVERGVALLRQLRAQQAIVVRAAAVARWAHQQHVVGRVLLQHVWKVPRNQGQGRRERERQRRLYTERETEASLHRVPAPSWSKARYPRRRLEDEHLQNCAPANAAREQSTVAEKETGGRASLNGLLAACLSKQE